MENEPTIIEEEAKKTQMKEGRRAIQKGTSKSKHETNQGQIEEEADIQEAKTRS